jgi:hypothetical protein
VTCYHRHLTGLFEQLDLAYDAEGRRRVHAAILTVLHMPADARCPEVWAGLKAAYGPVADSLPDLVRDVAAVLPQR